jgi:hypothetical protein
VGAVICDRSGISPENVVFVRLSAPDAAATESIDETVSRVEASSVPRERSAIRRDWLSVVVPSVLSPAPSSNSNCGPPPSSPGCACAPVTVRSVPTPYTDSSAWA